MISFTLNILPVAKGRPRFWNGRTLTDAKTRAYEKQIKILSKPFAPKVPFTEAVMVTLIFTFPEPKRPTRAYPCRGDLDNFTKAILDSFNGLFFVDDTQITFIQASKLYGPSASIQISIEEASDV